MRIAVDAAGSEPGPRVIVEGVLAAFEEFRASGAAFRPVLYGPGELLRRTLREMDVPTGEVEIVDAPEVIEMTDRPGEAVLQKQNSSIVRAAKDLAAGEVRAFVSMGNTGAVVGAARAHVGRMRWISRPALAVPLPRREAMGLLLDAGATMEPKATHLVQFAAMGAAFVERIYGVGEPRIGLMNIGVESHKGEERVQDAWRLLARSPLNFIGNVEGGDLLRDTADVIVTHGFVGNILLKFAESIPEMLREHNIPVEGDSALHRWLGTLDYRRYGGATLLGVNGSVVIGHGRSHPSAVMQALRWAGQMVRTDVPAAVKDRVFRTRRALWLSNPFARGEVSDDE